MSNDNKHRQAMIEHVDFDDSEQYQRIVTALDKKIKHNNGHLYN
jgi:hypothetical protein